MSTMRRWSVLLAWDEYDTDTEVTFREHDPDDMAAQSETGIKR